MMCVHEPARSFHEPTPLRPARVGNLGSRAGDGWLCLSNPWMHFTYPSNTSLLYFRLQPIAMATEPRTCTCQRQVFPEAALASHTESERGSSVIDRT